MSYKVGIYGATGYTGHILIDLLSKHPDAEILFATSESSREQVGGVELIPAAEAPLERADVVFLALPHVASGEVAAKAVAAGVHVIDLSADLRLDSADVYKQWYKHDHPAPHLLPAPFGLPEINRAKLRGARTIANPGCHVTAVLLALYPLAQAGALSTSAPVIADTKTGISGAGKALRTDSMFVEVYGDVRPYNVGRAHRHVPEIEQELHKLQPDCGALIFSPHVVPVDVGLLATVYITTRPEWTFERAYKAYTDAYLNEPLVSLLPSNVPAQMKMAAHKNNAVVGLSVGIETATHNILIATCAEDNLRKGAASQAVQNFNVMFGLDESRGLI